MDIKSNCPLCFEHELHVINKNDTNLMQCLSCGYATTDKFKIDNNSKKEENDAYKKLSEDMKKWSKTINNRIWIPTILTLPIGMLYPIDKDGEMKWAFAPMVKITEEEKEKYPNPNGGYYEKRIDTNSPIIYDEFIHGMSVVNNLMKNKTVDGQ